MKNIFLLINLMIITTSGNAATARTAEDFTNVVYGTHPSQRMDIHLPANRSKARTKSLVLIHGGGWTSGSRHSLTPYIDSFKRRMPGYAIFNIDYRLLRSGSHLALQEQDINAAITFISANADRYDINNSSLVLLGVSAGAHLAMLHAYKNTSVEIAAVIDFFGPTDLNAMYHKPWNPLIPQMMTTLMGSTPLTNPAGWNNASPVTFVNSAAAPTLIFHGRKDRMVNVSQSKLLQQKLENAGVPNRLVLYDAGHGWYGNVLGDSFDKIEVFLEEQVFAKNASKPGKG